MEFHTNPGTITLMGSGELAESMAKVHRAILARVEPDTRAVFVDTPAGFELNIDEISARAVEYFQKRFNIAISVASFRSKSRATALDVEGALNLLRHANFIFAGPGSPSYAIKNWRGSAVWDTIVARFAQELWHPVFHSENEINAEELDHRARDGVSDHDLAQHRRPRAIADHIAIKAHRHCGDKEEIENDKNDLVALMGFTITLDAHKVKPKEQAEDDDGFNDRNDERSVARSEYCRHDIPPRMVCGRETKRFENRY